MAEKKEKVYISLNKAFVKTNMQSKVKEGETFNMATLPKGTRIGGRDLGGYVFYPLYANPSKQNENVYTIPFLKDYEVQLHKNGETEVVSPEELRDGLKASYQEWKKSLEQRQEPEAGSSREYDWQGHSFSEYIRDYVDLRLDDLEDQTCFGGELADKIMEYDARTSTITCSQPETKAFLKEYFDEAGATHDWLKETEGVSQPDINIFDDPDAFQIAMVDKGVQDLLSENEYLVEHKDEAMRLDQETTKLIKSQLGIGASGKQSLLSHQKENNMDMEMEA